MIQLLDDPHIIIPILDQGYVRFIEGWGTGLSGIPEAGIIEAARMSTGRGFEGWEKDKGLLNYLYTNKHMTPFEMAGMVIEIKCPLMVVREWQRHRTQSYNEMSGRYIALPNENYTPDANNIIDRALIATSNKQARGTVDRVPELAEVNQWIWDLTTHYSTSERIIQKGLSLGIPKEIARLSTTLGRYTRFRAAGVLRNWLAFLTLRMDPHAQWEIRQFANVVGQVLIARHFPRTWELFCK